MSCFVENIFDQRIELGRAWRDPLTGGERKLLSLSGGVALFESSLCSIPLSLPESCWLEWVDGILESEAEDELRSPSQKAVKS